MAVPRPGARSLPRAGVRRRHRGLAFDRLDRNKDGYLSPEELAADEAKDRNWIAIDRDRDGRISRSEFNLIVAQPPKPQPGAAAGAGGSASPQPKQE